MHWFLLCFALIAGNVQPQELPQSPSRSTTKEQGESTKSKQESIQNQRGTEQSPVVVKVLPAPKPASEIAQEAKDREDKATSEWFAVKFNILLVTLNALLVVSTGALWWVTRKASNAAKQSAEAAERTADALQAQERAYVFIRDVVLEKFVLGPGGDAVGAELSWSAVFSLDATKDSPICFSLQNYGRTPAILKDVKAEAIYLRDFPAGAESLKSLPYPIGFILGAGEKTDVFRCSPIGANETWIEQLRRGKAHFFLYGSILYSDVFRNDWVVGFCWEYNPQTLSFGLSGNEQLNYEKKQGRSNEETGSE